MAAPEQPRKHRPSPSGPAGKTLLQTFLDANGFTSAQLERQIAMARPTMSRIRRGSDLRLSTMKRILAGVRQLSNRPVRMEEIFDLEPASS